MAKEGLKEEERILRYRWIDMVAYREATLIKKKEEQKVEQKNSRS